MTDEKEKNYYIKKKRTLMRTFDAVLKLSSQILVDKFGEDKFKEISIRARKQFEILIPNIPYIGGNNNSLTNDLINATFLLPLLKIFEKEGLDFNEIGKLTYELFEVFYKMMTEFKLKTERVRSHLAILIRHRKRQPLGLRRLYRKRPKARKERYSTFGYRM